MTIADNSVASGGSGGGLFVEPSGMATLDNSIVALNTNGTVGQRHFRNGVRLVQPDWHGRRWRLGWNNHNQSGITSAELNLGPLANNGGPTETMALLTGSVAIDAGSNSISRCNGPHD